MWFSNSPNSPAIGCIGEGASLVPAAWVRSPSPSLDIDAGPGDVAGTETGRHAGRAELPAALRSRNRNQSSGGCLMPEVARDFELHTNVKVFLLRRRFSDGDHARPHRRLLRLRCRVRDF